MAEPQRPEDQDLVERLVRIAGHLGMNTTRVRWRLLAAEKRWQQLLRRGEQRVDHVRYAHRVCASCGAVCDRQERVCHACGTRFSLRALEILGRLGLGGGGGAPGSATIFLALLILGAYVRQLVSCPGEGLLSFSSVCLVRCGGNVSSLVWHGEPWRVGTAMFLHIGVIHLGFNLYALAQVGPTVEDLFGRGRMLLWFMLTGLAGNLASAWVRDVGVAAGASGAIMGLIGIAAGWGLRDGTSIGKQCRDQMLKWAFYTLVLGYFIHADNAAHAGGLVAGALFGFVARPARLAWGSAAGRQTLAGLVGAAAAVACFVLVLAQPGKNSGRPNGRSAFTLPVPQDDPDSADEAPPSNPIPLQGD